MCICKVFRFSSLINHRRMSKRTKKRENGAALLVDTLQKRGIKLVAVDFDQTIITIHTGGYWTESVDNLLVKVRPCMKNFLELCLNRNLQVCIVTYSSQPLLIKDLLYKLFRRESEKILIQANTPAFREKHNYEFLGKEAHITAILTELYNKQQMKIRPDEVILFDDDKDNTDIAMKFGHMTFLVNEDVCEETFQDFAQGLEVTGLRKSWAK